MSTPSPANNITLPATNSYGVSIDNDAYKNAGTTTLAFLAGLNDEWSAHYTVDDQNGKTIIEESKLAVTAPTALKYVFQFEMIDPTPAQINAGYIAGKYTFSFDPPGTDPAEFDGTLKDPRPGDEVDDWTATKVDLEEDAEVEEPEGY